MCRFTIWSDVDERIIGHDQFVEVEFIGEPLPLCFMQDPFIVIISENDEHVSKQKK